MVKMSNNLIAVLLVVAIAISGFGLMTVMTLTRAPPLAGRATATGTANVTITGAVAIEMIRNVSDFDTGSLDGATRILTTQQDNYGTFDDGSEGNGTTNYGICNDVEQNCTYPFVLWNSGNLNASINISTGSEAAGWIGTGAGAYFKGANNASGTCGLNFTQPGNLGEGLWTPLNVSERIICNQMDFGTSDTIRIHFNLSIPGDAVGVKGQIITIGAIQAS